MMDNTLIEKVEQPVLIIVGPTAIGKTELSLELAEQYDCEIISADSMQVYRHMDIGTAKVSVDERKRVAHHLIDIADPDEAYDAVRFADDCFKAIADIHKRGKRVLITGGTGLYIKSLLYGIFPEAPSDEKIRTTLKERLAREGCDVLHKELVACDCLSAAKIHKNDSQRLLRALEVYLLTGVPWSEHLAAHQKDNSRAKFENLLQIGLTCDRSLLYERINTRTKLMVETGLEDEVRSLLSMGYGPELKPMMAIGYKHMINYVNGKWPKTEMIELLARDTRRYAKRQYTWFTKSKELHWLEVSEKNNIFSRVEQWLDI